MDLVRANAGNLVALKPDVIVALGGRIIPILMNLTRTVAIIIPGTADDHGRHQTQDRSVGGATGRRRFFPAGRDGFALGNPLTAIVARLRVPTIYRGRVFVTSGGLASYDSDRIDIFAAPRPTSTAFCAGKTWRSAVSAADKMPAHDQSQDRQGARPHNSAVRAAASG